MSTRKTCRATQPPLLATVTPLPVQSLEHRTRDLLHTLHAAGITATSSQAQALAEHGMTGLGCWVSTNDLATADRAASVHFSIAKLAQHLATQPTAQSNVKPIRKENTR